jgi:hypothetical protein
VKKSLSICLAILILISITFYVFAEQNIIVKLQVGSKNAKINEKSVVLDAPPIVQNGRTLVPLRFIGEAFGAKIDWEASTRSITLTLPDINSLKNEIDSLNNQLTTLKAEYEEKITNLNKEISDFNLKVAEKDQEITDKQKELDRIKAEYEEKITNLEKTISELNDKVKDLEDKLANSRGEEKDPPIIKLDNIKDGQNITEKINILGKIEDKSQITFVRAKLGTYLLFEDNKLSGVIDPVNFASGEYSLSIEAIDAFANKGTMNIKINIKNDEKLNPVKVTAIATDQQISQTDAMPYFSALIVNNSLANVEILKIDAYDKDGILFEIQPGMNLFDLIKAQMGGLEHLWVHSKEKIALPAAVDMTQSGKKAKDFFVGWKVAVTLYDSIMEKEYTLESVFKTK